MKYRICDLRKGAFADDEYVEAKSPKNALTKCGYTDIIRDNFGDVIVYGNRGSYVYRATKMNQTFMYVSQ